MSGSKVNDEDDEMLALGYSWQCGRAQHGGCTKADCVCGCHHEENPHVAALEARLALVEAALAEAERTAQVRADYNLRCEDCHGSVFLDTVIPSPVWNAICRNGANDAEMLCTLCIDKRLKLAGIEGTQAEFYYAGDALVSRLYANHEALNPTAVPSSAEE